MYTYYECRKRAGLEMASLHIKLNYAGYKRIGVPLFFQKKIIDKGKERKKEWGWGNVVYISE